MPELTFQVIDFFHEAVKDEGAERGVVYLAGVGESGEPLRVAVEGFLPSALIVPVEDDGVAPPRERDASWERVCHELSEENPLCAATASLWPLCGYAAEPSTCVRVRAPSTRTAENVASRMLAASQAQRSVLQRAKILPTDSVEQQFYNETGLRPCGFASVETTGPGVSFDGGIMEHTADVASLRPLPYRTAPATVCVFDIECVSARGGFPDATHPDDFVEQIGLALHDTSEAGPRRLILLSRQALSEEDVAWEGEGRVEVESFDGEESLLILRFAALVRDLGVTHLVAHNGLGFDVPYLVARATRGGYAKAFLGSLSPHGTTRECTAEERMLQNNQLGAYAITDVNPFGVVVHDTLIYFRKSFTHSSYSLNSLADAYLGGRQKLDMPPRSMFRAFLAGERRALGEVARYCVVDCILALDLVAKVKMIHALYGMSSVSVTTLQKFLLVGEQRKSYNVVLAKCHDMGYYIDQDALPAPSVDGYKGATVMEPVLGYHDRPVLGLDFASLYPSIMQAYNLCFSTCEWVCSGPRRDPALGEHQRDVYPGIGSADGTSPASGTAVSFVKASVRRGVLPTLLSDLLAARKQAKRQMREAETPFDKMIFDQLQRAYKVSCNAIYGFCGVGAVPDENCQSFPRCFQLPRSRARFARSRPVRSCACYRGALTNKFVARAVTSRGRELLSRAARSVTERWPAARVVYGDTDSCYVDAGLPATVAGLRQGLSLGADMAEHVTASLPRPIELEFEKVMWPFLQIAKKRYVYVEWEPPSEPGAPLKPPKRGAKGVESQRRDNSAWLRTVYEAVTRVLLPIPDPSGDQGAGIDRRRISTALRQIVHDHLAEMVRGDVPLEQFVISKQLASQEYATPQIHAVLAGRIRERVAAGKMTCEAPQAGDRVSFVVIQGYRKQKLVERGEDPSFLKNRTIDRAYYVGKCRDAVCRLCDTVVPLADLFDAAIDGIPHLDPRQTVLSGSGPARKAHTGKVLRRLKTLLGGKPEAEPEAEPEEGKLEPEAAMKPEPKAAMMPEPEAEPKAAAKPENAKATVQKTLPWAAPPDPASGTPGKGRKRQRSAKKKETKGQGQTRLPWAPRPSP
ncbi:MAG: DNA polymerase domain-containing protein [Ilumatobacteraceae bacterium]